ncbi:hypothetical protein MtrunA17_Chr3g0091891 [Medicago truncatula]|uniref:Uncharacterized protein n=1 Tax=Medicago truncatula TaxID=3880 RepID=A0A072UUJ3_MEDTR|nr:hypothetical protein MTR_3g435080 [Medicago truncatula]RHN66510.1 hypothetical protein MtrunA17_Chr3g0091891 [Medicago truncatula]
MLQYNGGTYLCDQHHQYNGLFIILCQNLITSSMQMRRPGDFHLSLHYMSFRILKEALLCRSFCSSVNTRETTTSVIGGCQTSNMEVQVCNEQVDAELASAATSGYVFRL